MPRGQVPKSASGARDNNVPIIWELGGVLSADRSNAPLELGPSFASALPQTKPKGDTCDERCGERQNAARSKKRNENCDSAAGRRAGVNKIPATKQGLP